jgi:hypothetical protein
VVKASTSWPVEKGNARPIHMTVVVAWTAANDNRSQLDRAPAVGRHLG